MRVIEEDKVSNAKLQVGDVIRVKDHGYEEANYKLVVCLGYNEFATIDLGECIVGHKTSSLAGLLEYYNLAWDEVLVISKEHVQIFLGGK